MWDVCFSVEIPFQMTGFVHASEYPVKYDKTNALFLHIDATYRAVRGEPLFQSLADGNP